MSDVITIYKKIKEKFGAVRNHISKIENIIFESPFDRRKVGFQVYQLKTTLKTLKTTIEESRDLSISSQKNLGRELWQKGEKGKAIFYGIIEGISEITDPKKIESFIYSLGTKAYNLTETRVSDGSYKYSDERLKGELLEITSSLRNRLDLWEVKASKSFSKVYGLEADPITSTIKFLWDLADWPSLDEKWACLACHLAALQICVDKACKQLGIQAKNFKGRVKNLVNLMQSREIEISDLEKDIHQRFYDYRNKVLHAGKVPGRKVYQYILDEIPSFIKKIKRTLRDK